MENTFTTEFSEVFHYSVSNKPSIKELVTSLQGLEAIIKQSRGVLASLTGSDIADIEVRVRKLEAGSLIEDLFITLFFRDKENMDICLKSIHDKYIGDGSMRNALLWAVITGLITMGMYMAVKTMSPNNTSHLEANNNTIINIGAEAAGISKEKLRSLIDSSLTDKKNLAKSVVKVLSPARNDENATLNIGSGDHVITIDSQTIRKTPTSVEFEPDTYTTEYKDVDLQIRALDRDNPKKGWAAVIPGLIDRRAELILSDEIKPEQLSHKFTYRADVEITYKLKEKRNKYQPVKIFLVQLVSD